MLPLTVAEYFAGIGLFRMGLEKVGWKVRYANDWDPIRASMYRGFFGDTYDVADIFAVCVDNIPQTTLATCSFPCIDLSLAGNQRGLEGTHSSAFWGFHSLLQQQGEQAPPVVLLENVGGWMSSNKGEDFYAVAQALNILGYACDAFTLNARCFVPQSRPRVFMVGVKEALMPSGWDAETQPTALRSSRLAPKNLQQLLRNNGRIRWINLTIPEPPPYKNSGFTDEIVERLESSDSRWWPEDQVDRHLAMMPPAHLDMVKGLAQGNNTKARTFYRRRRTAGQRAEVRSDDIAGCLRTAVGGSGKQFMVVAGQGEIRMRTLTAREYARLQGVKDALPIKGGTERQTLNAFGDAVCVPVVSWIAKNVLEPVVEQLNPN